MTEEQENTSALHLLDRTADPHYLQEWTTWLQNEKLSVAETHENPVVIFRLQKEWLALSTQVFREVAPMRPIHRIPHRSGKILLGLVNMRGQLQLCVALDKLLEIESEDIPVDGEQTKTYRRMLEINKGGDSWIFSADEVYGIYRFDTKVLQNVPVTVVKSTANFFRGVFNWKGKSVGFLDDELVFASLKRSVL